MEEYSIVKVVRLLTEGRDFYGTDDVMRPPEIGDTGTIVHVHTPGESYVVENVDSDGYTIWVADFDEAELELVEESKMSERIETVTAELSKTADEAETTFSGLSQDQLNWNPSEKGWSVAQCFDHLITTHSLYFPLFEKLGNGDAAPTFWERYSPLSGFFGRFLVRSLDPKNQKKMKTTSKAQPSASTIEAGIVNCYVEHQQKIIEALRKIPADIDSLKTIITSPLLGVVTYSLDDCYTILVVHGQRHLGQAKRVTQTEGFPG